MFANITNKSQYQIATSRVNTSVLIGKFSCGLLAQIFISFRPECSSYTYLLSLSIIGKYIFDNLRLSTVLKQNEGSILFKRAADGYLLRSIT